MIGGLDLWGSWSSWPPGGYLAPLVVLIGIAGVAWTWVVADPRSPAMPLAALVSTLASTLGAEGIGIHVRQYYTTDSGAFNQVAARLLQQGHDPYTSTMAAATQLLNTPSDYWTYTVSGGHVTAVSYPAGSFLLEVPALLLGFHHQIVDWVDLLAWLVTGVLVFVLVPTSIRWLAPLLVATPLYADVFSSGGTDAAFLPFLVLAVWRWDRFGQARGAGLARWVGPVALGLACSIKQTPWFCVAFIAMGLFIEARASGRHAVRLVVGYVAIVATVFTAVNLPFIVWQPTAWLRGTLLPIRQPLVADGQGLVTLALHGVARGVSLPWLSVAAGLVYLALLGALAAWYPVMKRIWLLVLPLVFFVAPRSLLSYLLDLLPAAIVAAATVAPAPSPSRASRPDGATRAGRWRVPVGMAAVVPAVVAVAMAVLAFASPPLQLDVRSFVSSQAATSLDAVTVEVHNSTGQTVVPHFMVTIGSSHPDGFWHTASGRPVVLSPHDSAVVTLLPPVYAGAPTHGSYWLVAAYTSSPEALSTTPLQLWRLGKAR
jgi:hypothetical protein